MIIDEWMIVISIGIGTIYYEIENNMEYIKYFKKLEFFYKHDFLFFGYFFNFCIGNNASLQGLII